MIASAWTSPDFSMRPDGAHRQWRKVPPGGLSVWSGSWQAARPGPVRDAGQPAFLARFARTSREAAQSPAPPYWVTTPGLAKSRVFGRPAPPRHRARVFALQKPHPSEVPVIARRRRNARGDPDELAVAGLLRPLRTALAMARHSWLRFLRQQVLVSRSPPRGACPADLCPRAWSRARQMGPGATDAGSGNAGGAR
jgi:hypothetical protein